MDCFCVFGREMNRRQTYEQANKIYDKAMKLEQEFGEYFTGMNVESSGQADASSGTSRQSSNAQGASQPLSADLSLGTQGPCQSPVSQGLAQALLVPLFHL